MVKFHGLVLNILFIYIVCAFLSCEECCFVYCLRLESSKGGYGQKPHLRKNQCAPLESYRHFHAF